MKVAGFDIGGTKCAVIIADVGKEIKFLSRTEFKTEGQPFEIIDKLIEITLYKISELGLAVKDIDCGGISCGGPLDSKSGIIMSPPNLPHWDNIHICDYMTEKLGFPVKLKNDADACAIAEWKYGGGMGYDNVIFLTFGTGLGAGLILNGKLYSGASSMAGEVGHMRLTDDGPCGYGKNGSFEGWCSGGGIIKQADKYFSDLENQGVKTYYKGKGSVDGKILFMKAQQKDKFAIDIFANVGKMLGKGLAVLMDILNPDVIIIGGVYMRAHKFIDSSMWTELKKECLSLSLDKLKILPSVLGEKIGDYGAVVSALE